jgi:glutamine amidotransferase
MCRLLGIATSEPTAFRIVLRESPRSLAALSREHPDGWGMAVFEARAMSPHWRLHKAPACATDDSRFHELAMAERGEVLVSHIRQKTVGPTSVHNTHPFQRGRWVFAHNGTVKDIPYLRRRSSAARLAEIQGDTDSEVLFAYFLTKLDEAGLSGSPADGETDRVVATASREARAHPDIGAFNFLLSDGETIYAHRFGRTMHLLERGPGDTVRRSRTSPEDGSIVHTPWSQRRSAIFIASERMTDEPWEPIEDGMLLRIDRTPVPRWRLVA